ncbi:MAG TPA: PRC-barrel domain-containing protein [Tianweitania sediminis]|jgi:sporulation protein YlmC with PRC-barrel domain|nr:PRC-barrel domain-containing protein [Tianweitania sediminis]
MTKTPILLAAAFVGLSLPAFAQTSWVEIDDDVMVAPFNVEADDLDDMDVHNSAGQEIGEVEEVIGTNETTPTALVVEFDGEAGYPDRDDVVVPLDRFSMNGDRLVLNADAAAVEGFQTYDD